MNFSHLLLQTRLRDGGGPYTETDLSRLIVEPWNGTSAILFLFIVGYWAWKLRGQYQDHLFLSMGTGVLAIGGIGGTLYHLFRLYQVFLIMDWLPILLLCLAASAYFFVKAGGKWWAAITILLGFFLGTGYLFSDPGRVGIDPTITGQMSLLISINYILMAILVLGPVVWYLVRTRFVQGKWVGLALLAFLAAIFFRIADPWGWLPMGTHFLWHVFGAVACHSMFQYVYASQSLELAR